MRTALFLVAWMGAIGFAPAYASDHTDDLVVTLDPSADLTDLYAWVSTDLATSTSTLNVVLNIRGIPSSSILYAVHIDSLATYGTETSTNAQLTAVCEFPNDTEVQCWLTRPTDTEQLDYSRGNVNTTVRSFAQLSNEPGFTVFAGRRPEIAFFHREGLERAQLQLPPSTDATCRPLGTDVAASVLTGPNTYAEDIVSSVVLGISMTFFENPVLALWAASYENPPPSETDPSDAGVSDAGP